MRFGQYQILETLKQRGAVVTCRARDEAQDRGVILKMLQKDAVTPALVDSLRREYGLIQEIRSPRVLTAYDLIWDDDCPALVLQDLGGNVLSDMLGDGKLEPVVALRLAIAATQALEAVHDAGIMHGDINPSNLIVGETPDDVVLIDFGFSERGGLPAGQAAGLRGSPDYIAPEMTGRLSRGADHRADLYSLGALIYRMLTGSVPFPSADLLQSVYAHMALRPRPLRDLAPTVPDVVADVVARLMAKEPELRYQTAAGLITDLRNCLALVNGDYDTSAFELGQNDVPRRLSVSAVVHGRQAETQMLRDAFDGVRTGVTPGVTIRVMGGAGVGKSTLVESLATYVGGDGGLFVKGRVDAGAWDDPIGGLVGAARRLAELLLTERYGAVQDWQHRLSEDLGDLLPVLAALAPEIAALAGNPAPAPRLPPRENAERLGIAFRGFFRACGTPEHPLVLVFEDVHAADAATLAILDRLTRADGSERMLLILTRRTGPDEAPQPGADDDHTIVLSDLHAEDITQLLTETFRLPAETTAPLATALLSRVGGAPLAIGQIIGALVDEDIIRFDVDQNRWVWDIGAVMARDASDDVVEILLQRGARLSAADRAVVGAVACIGREFTLAQAELAAGASAQEVRAPLEHALSMGWLVPVVASQEAGHAPALRFSHDRIWLAATSMQDPQDRRATHARLAAQLLSQTAGPPQGEVAFDVARHLKESLGPQSGPAEIGLTRGLNAAAGAQAIAVGDLPRSHSCMQTAADLLSAPDWQDAPGEALGITAGAAGAALLVGAFDEVEDRLQTFMDHCPDPVGRAGVQALNVFCHLAQDRPFDAVEIGRAALAELGDPLPAAPGPAEIEAEIGSIFAALAGRSIDDLAALPDVGDPAQAAVQETLAAILFPAFSSNPMMFATCAARLAARAVAHGFTEHSVVGFNDVGLVACGPMNQVDMGYAFSQVAQRLVAEKNLVGLRPRVEAIYNAFIRHRKEPIRATLPGLIAARDAGVSCGDVFSAALTSFDYGFQVFWIGERLDDADEAMGDAHVFCADLNAGLMPDLINIYRQTCVALRDGAATPELLSGDCANGGELLDIFAGQQNSNGLAQLHISQMLLAHVYGRRQAALAQGRRAVPCLSGIVSTPALPAFHAIFAMIAVPAAQDDAVTADDLEVLQQGAELTEYWAAECDDNYRHHAQIVRAELALANGDYAVWQETMEAAVDQATRQSFTRDAALILERVALVNQARGRTRRYSHFIRDAWRAWVHYGAEAKVAAMSQAHRGVLDSFAAPADGDDHSLSLSLHDEHLDLGALLKATRTISQEVRLADLLGALLAGVVETAGADYALVVAPDRGDFKVIAELAGGPDGPVYSGVPDVENARACAPDVAPLSALRLVARSHAALSSSEVLADARLSGDVFFQGRLPKSLAIVPLIKGGRLLGLMYLENRSVADAFSGVRMKLLSALCAQAAISWDNAVLYDQQSQLLAAADRFVPAELSRLFHRDSIADVQLTDARSRRMTIMVSDLRGSTAQAERLGPKQTFFQINAFLTGFSKTVREHGGFVLKYVGDGALALFPDGPAQAMDAAIAYQAQLRAQDWESSGETRLNVGIAIHSGEVMFGVVGDNTRMQIDALSDAVNVAFRIEAQTKPLGVKVLVSDEALTDLADADKGVRQCRYLGEVETQGRKELARVHELIDAEQDELRQAKAAALDMFESGVHLFESKDFVSACVNFGSVLRDNPGDTAAAKLFQEAAQRVNQKPVQ